MKTQLDTRPVQEIESDVLAVLAFDKEAPRESAVLRDVNERAGGWIEEVFASGEFAGKIFDIAMLHRPAGLKARRLLLAGCGKPAGFDAAELRKVAGAVVRFAKVRAAKDITLVLDGPHAEPGCVAAAAEGALLGHFEPDRYKTDRSDEKRVDAFTLSVPGTRQAELQSALERGRIIAESQNFTRELVNEPANRLTPMLLADRARAMAVECGLDCEVLDRGRMEQMGMGALLGVAQGSAEPPALIVVRYRPEKECGGAHLALIGKGVTFDTGGISIKPADGMEKMKYDMAGAASVLGAMRAIARLKPAVKVTALAPAVENMPGGRAQRPGDIVTSLSGKTVEVLNTDAEGRLILVDAIEYARRLGCTHMVDAATLTGAIVVALGHVRVGAFTNNDALLERVLAASRAAGEKSWPMPLDEEYKDYLKSAFADLPNVGNRWGGAVTAAYFLKEFAGDTPWVHLDIAGTAWLDDAKPYLAKGPSGVPMRTFVNLVMNW